MLSLIIGCNEYSTEISQEIGSVKEEPSDFFTQGSESSENTEKLFDFSKESHSEWFLVNDDVMGGVSRSEISLHPKGYLVFEGLLSTDYGGGFASLRSNYVNWEIANSDGIILKVRGDGKIYQFRCRMGNDYYDIAYRSFFKSKKNLWQVIKLPFREFVPTYRGRIVTGMPSLDPKDIRSFGLMISEKQVGDFRLEVSWIGVY